MPRTVTLCTVPVFTGTTDDGLTFADITVLLVRMTTAQVTAWSWVGNVWNGTAPPLEGYEVRDANGALLGAVLPLGHRTRRYHIEWYDPAAEDFFFAGEADAVRTEWVARVLDKRFRHVGPIPAGEDFTEHPRYRHPRTRFCPWICCFDPECIDHGPIWVKAA